MRWRRGSPTSRTGSLVPDVTDELLPSTGWTRVRTFVNWINLSTPLGFLVARLGGARVERRGRGTWLAGGYRYDFPVAGAFTIGGVIISRSTTDSLRGRPTLLAHEDRHVTQYGFCLGVPMLLLYFASVGVSWVVAGNHYAYNPFERLAGLAEGGYAAPQTRWAARRLRRQTARSDSRDDLSRDVD